MSFYCFKVKGKTGLWFQKQRCESDSSSHLNHNTTRDPQGEPEIRNHGANKMEQIKLEAGKMPLNFK